MCRTGNLTQLIHTLAICVTILRPRFVAARDTKTGRARQQQQANANAAAKAASKVPHEETNRRAGNYNGGSRHAKYNSAAGFEYRLYFARGRIIVIILQSCQALHPSTGLCYVEGDTPLTSVF